MAIVPTWRRGTEGRSAYKHHMKIVPSRGKPHMIIDTADTPVVEVFRRMQKVWRRQGTLRRTYNGMPTSREERESWRQLIQYLTDLPPPRN